MTVFGVDMVRVSFLAGSVSLAGVPFLPAPDRWDRWQDGQSVGQLPRRSYLKQHLPAGEASAYVKATEGHAGGYVVVVEWNPSRVMLGEGGGLASVRQAQESLVLVSAALAPLVPHTADRLATAGLRRLDVARDLAGEGELVPFVLGALAPHGSRSYRNQRTGDVETVYWDGAKGNSVRVYDKAAQLGAYGVPVPEGTAGWLRTEAQARRAWLDRHQLRVLGDLTDERVDTLGRWYWEYAGLGEVIGVREKDAVRTLMHDGVPDQVILGFIGWLHTRELCGPSPHRNTLTRYRALERRLGGAVSLDEPAAVGGVQLDLESGEIRRVPA